MNYQDRRGKRVVFVSHCLLDQNVRFPGIAVAEGCVRPLIGRLCDEGLGIEQLPCLEVRYWGGIERKFVLPLLRLSPRLIEGPMRGLFFGAIKLFLGAFRLLCEVEAWKVTRVIESFARGGCSVTGIIVMNDSPTCGYSRTTDVRKFVTEAPGAGVDWSCPTYEKMSGLLPTVLCAGSGSFVGALKRRLEKRRMDIPFIGFDPWTDGELESERLLGELLGEEAGAG
ncbi:MAG: hypothetical protein ACYC99_04635 [Candidatus Geothermincolia bacterium]